MSARSKARKRALDILFEAELRGISALSLLEANPPEDLSQGAYSELVVKGVEVHRERIDDIINTYAEGWDLDRMPSVDRNLLRIAIFEILGVPEVDDAVAISEAVSLAHDLSTLESPGYINGVLGRIVILKSTLFL